MMRRLLILMAVIAACIGSAMADGRPYVLSVGDFTSLKVNNSIPVVYRCNADSAGVVTFVAPDAAVSYYEFINNNNTLRIQYSAESVAKRPEVLPVVTVYSTMLENVVNSGDSLVYVDLSAKNTAPQNKLKVRTVGNGALTVVGILASKVEANLATGRGLITLEGRCHSLGVRFGGTGRIDAWDLECAEASISAFGTGNIDCRPMQVLKVFGIGSTTITYQGSPKITNRSTGLKIVKSE